jgi:membrane-bound serine protease (ClpP class)
MHRLSGADGCRLVVLALALAVWTLPAVLGAAQKPDSEPLPTQQAAILPIHGEITDVMVTSLKRRIEDARRDGATVIIFDINTPGGLVTSSIAAADLIKNLRGVKTVAWVNPNAHSGGAIVAVACDEIVMARSSRIGDSQVIMGGPTGVTAVPEELQPKAYTPVLTEFRASCRLRGYDQVLCEAFVLPDREVWWLENIKTGERKFVFAEEKAKLLGEDVKPAKPEAAQTPKPPDTGATIAPADAPASTPPAPEVKTTPARETEWKLVQTYYDPLLEIEVNTIQPIVPKNQLLEMSPAEAFAYGFSRGIVADEGDLRVRYSLSTIVRVEPTWSENLAYWLTSIYVRGFLMVIILLGAYVEFHTPGVWVPGLVALICLAIFVGAPYLTGLANVWEVLCIVVGFLLIALEVFVIPGFGVAGIAGIVLVIVGLLATFVPDEPGRDFPLYVPTLPSTLRALKIAVLTVASSLVASLLGMVMLSRFLPRVPVLGRIVPANPTPSQVAVDDPYGGLARVGDVGEAVGPLHPAGKARFASQLVDVVTQGDYLETGARVEVIERRGNRVVVRAIM